MLRYFVLFLVLNAALAGGIACSTQANKKVSPDAELAEDVVNVVRSAFQFFDDGRYDDFGRSWVSPEAAASISRFPGAAKHEYTLRMVELDDQNFRVSVAWSCMWHLGDQKRRGSGTAVFLLTGTPARITEIAGESPFIAPNLGQD